MTFYDLAKERNNSENYQKIYDIIASREKINVYGVNDGQHNHTTNEIEEIRTLQYEQVKSNIVKDGGSFQSLDETKQELKYKIRDGFYNESTGIGTINDPSMYNTSYTPTSISPYEATSLYASGGLTKIIVDKKSKTLLLNGYEFDGELTPDEAKELKDYSLRKGFDKALLSAIRDGIIFGGSILLPYFQNDTYISMTQSIDELISSGILTKNCIDYFISVDRWNTVVIPDYVITHKDYLMPKEFYIPLGSLRVKTQRAALIKPYPQPYWSAIKQLGWSPSDYEGYIRQILGYEIMIQTMPMMFQQMSLLFQVFPIDSTIAMNGPEAVRDFVKQNEDKMREWSMVNPKAINSFGDIKVVERHYQGIQEMFMIVRQDIASRCSIPESVLFHSQPTGFSDNKEDVTLKQSEAIKMIESEISYSLKNLIKIMAISCFGTDHEVIQKNKNIDIVFSNPIVLSDVEKATNGLQLSQMIGQLVTAGMPLDIAINNAKQFFPSFEIEDEDIERLQGVSSQETEGFGETKENLFDMLKGKLA